MVEVVLCAIELIWPTRSLGGVAFSFSNFSVLLRLTQAPPPSTVRTRIPLRQVA